MKITAKFIGPKPSMGYEPGVEYEFDLRGMTIYPKSLRQKSCPYSSIEAFLRNWTVVKVVV